MVRMNVVFSSSRGATAEELIEKSSIYYELLSDIPTESLEEVFKRAKTKCLHFPRPKVILEQWESVKASDMAWRNAETLRLKNNAIDGDELASDEEHKACIKIIMAVCAGRLDEAKGQELMGQAFKGKITG